MIKPISEKEFELILSKSNFTCEKFPHVAIGFSGGSDSLALLLLMKDWIKSHDGSLTIIYFNHKLRKESLNELKFAKNLAYKFKFHFKALEWNSKNQKKNSIMQQAREIRYKEIINYCKDKKIISFMTGHHFDDSLETFVMRKKRKFATLGLSSIPETHYKKNLQIIRPLIGIEKKRLIQTCLLKNYKWMDDISNKNSIFERVRIRKELRVLNKKSRILLSNEFKKLKKKNFQIEQKLGLFFVENLMFEEYGKFIVSKQKIVKIKDYLQIEIFKKLLVTCSGNIFPPKTKTISDILQKLKNKKSTKFALHSCIINIKSYHIEFYREWKKTKELMKRKNEIKKLVTFIWDERFKIYSRYSDLSCHVLDDNLWLKLKNDFKLLKLSRGVSYDILRTLPILKIKEKYLIPFISPVKDLKDNGVEVFFEPKIPLTKKNF